MKNLSIVFDNLSIYNETTYSTNINNSFKKTGIYKNIDNIEKTKFENSLHKINQEIEKRATNPAYVIGMWLGDLMEVCGSIRNAFLFTRLDEFN
jgi:hypothetical protein